MNPMTTMSVGGDGPSATMNKKATITTGSASTASTTRPTTMSIAPPRYPMARPSAVPSTVPSTVASRVMNRMSLAPTMTLDRTSRPSWSVPNQCIDDGALFVASSCCT